LNLQLFLSYCTEGVTSTHWLTRLEISCKKTVLLLLPIWQRPMTCQEILSIR